MKRPGNEGGQVFCPVSRPHPARRPRFGRCGFTLIEVLLALVLLAFIGIILLAWQRWLLLTEAKTSRWLLARDRGQRVLSFLEPRVAHCGLGFSACSGMGALQSAFGRGVANAPHIAGWNESVRSLRVHNEGASWPSASDEGGVYRGTRLSLLYARPSRVIVRTRSGLPAVILPGQAANFDIIAGSLSASGFESGKFVDLRSWCALPLAGLPFFLSSALGNSLSLTLAAPLEGAVLIPPVHELYLLRCERFCVVNNIFCFQSLESAWYPPDFYPREEGILALWFEWRPALKCLDAWVLASGGAAAFGTASRPASWPQDAPWEKEFARHELYVARASWKVENL